MKYRKSFKCEMRDGDRKKAKKATWIVERSFPNLRLPSEFTPVIESSAGKKASQPLTYRVRCTSCRLNPSDRGLCIHEKSAIDSVAELDEKADADDEMESIDPISAKVCYTSILPRRAVPCPADQLAIKRFCSSIIRCQFERAKQELVDSNGIGKAPDGTIPQDYIAGDSKRICKTCGHVLISSGPSKNCGTSLRRVKLHTFLHGTTLISVLDLRYPICSRETVFDGSCFALQANLP